MRYAVVLTLIVVAAPAVAADPPRLTGMLPGGIAPGAETTVTLTGQRLTMPVTLWTSFSARWQFAKTGDEASEQPADRISFRLTVPRDEPPGIGAVRIATVDGVSNPLLILVDDLSSTSKVGGNHTGDSAQPISAPAAVDGTCDAIREDHYRLHVRAGQHLSLEVVAQRIGSALDPVLRLLDAGGTVIVRRDDDPVIGGDCRIAHDFQSEAVCYAVVRDVDFRGGSGFRYRLRIGEFPVHGIAYPLGGRAGTVATFDVLTPPTSTGAVMAPVHIRLPDVDQPRIVPFAIAGPSSHGSALLNVRAGVHPDVIESEPNDGPTESVVVQAPCVLNGRLECPDDCDRFQFEAAQDSVFRMSAFTQQLGSPCQLLVRIVDQDGTNIAECVQVERPSLRFTIPRNGKYDIVVEDLLRQGGPAHAYRITLEPAEPGFHLTAEVDRVTTPHGGTFEVPIKCQRAGYDGPIQLAVEGLGPAATVTEHVLGEPGKPAGETTLKVTVPRDVQRGELLLARVIGTAEINGKTFQAAASTRPALRREFPNTPYPPSALERDIAVGIGAPFPPFFELSLGADPAYFVKSLPSSNFTVQVKRLNNEFNSPVTLEIDGLPEGVEASVEPANEKHSEYRVTLTGPDDVPVGQHKFTLRGTGTFKNQTKKVELADIPLHVVNPLAVEVAMAGPIPVGGKHQAVVRIVRHRGANGPVELRWTDGPTGLVAPIVTTIRKGENQATVELAAAADAAAGTFDNLVVSAATTVGDRSIEVRSPPARIEIKQGDLQ